MKPECSLAPASRMIDSPPALSQLQRDPDGKPSAALAAPLGQGAERKTQVKVFRLLHKRTAIISISEMIGLAESCLQNSGRNL